MRILYEIKSLITQHKAGFTEGMKYILAIVVIVI